MIWVLKEGRRKIEAELINPSIARRHEMATVEARPSPLCPCALRPRGSWCACPRYPSAAAACWETTSRLGRPWACRGLWWLLGRAAKPKIRACVRGATPAPSGLREPPRGRPGTRMTEPLLNCLLLGRRELAPFGAGVTLGARFAPSPATRGTTWQAVNCRFVSEELARRGSTKQ